MEEISVKFQENYEIFWSKYMKNSLFHIFTKYFLDFWLRSESKYLCKIISDFYNNSSHIGEGMEPSGVSLPLPTLLMICPIPTIKIETWKVFVYLQYINKCSKFQFRK